jgi:hypothetical protein
VHIKKRKQLESGLSAGSSHGRRSQQAGRNGMIKERFLLLSVDPIQLLIMKIPGGHAIGLRECGGIRDQGIKQKLAFTMLMVLAARWISRIRPVGMGMLYDAAIRKGMLMMMRYVDMRNQTQRQDHKQQEACFYKLEETLRWNNANNHSHEPYNCCKYTIVI